MEIRNSLDALKSLLGVKGTTPSTQTAKSTAAASHAVSGLGSDQATLSNAGNEVSLAASDSDVRAGKVVAVQAALATGSYHVPASAVASKLVDSMLGKGN